MSRGRQKEVTCMQCGITFMAFNSDVNSGGGKYCTQDCYHQSRIGRKRSDEWKKMMSKKLKGRKITWETKGFKKGHIISDETKKKMSETHKRVGTRPPVCKRFGPDNNLWKGGVTKLKDQVRSSARYKEWRTAIFIRDGYACVSCGDGGHLHVDHIKPYHIVIKENNITNIDEALSCDELWDESNGRTMCIPCHKKTDTYLKHFGGSQIDKETHGKH